MGCAMKELIDLVPAEHLPELEKYFKQLASMTRAKVIRRDMSLAIKKQVDRQKLTLAELVSRTMKRIRSGIPRDTAIEIGCNEPPHPSFECLDAWLKIAEKKQASEQRKRRDARIAKMAHDGHKNAEIAKTMGVSISTVATALKRSK